MSGLKEGAFPAIVADMPVFAENILATITPLAPSITDPSHHRANYS